MDEEPVEPEVVGHGFTFRTFSSPWTLMAGLGALGLAGTLGTMALAAVALFSVGWLFLLALVYRWLWGIAFTPELTRLVYGADALSYKKALATTALLVFVSWLVSPKRS